MQTATPAEADRLGGDGIEHLSFSMTDRAELDAHRASLLEQGIAGSADVVVSVPSSTTAPLHEARDRFERDYILRALAAQQGNISRTAEALGIERSNLYRKMRAFGIMPARKSEDEEAV